jgi:hypothetical protein
MAESFGNELAIIEVTADDLARPRKQLWVAAAKPSQALTLVLICCSRRLNSGDCK